MRRFPYATGRPSTRRVHLGRQICRALVLSAQLVLAGCGASATSDPGGGGIPSSPSVTAIVIAPTALTLSVGEAGSLTATLSTTGGAPAGGWTTTWQSSDASIVAVSGSGTPTALARTGPVVQSAGSRTWNNAHHCNDHRP